MNFKGGKIKKQCINCGKEYSVFLYRKEDTKFCSKKCNAMHRTGVNAANWRGGIDLENKRIRKSIEYEIWRNEIYKKDNWTCRICNKKCKSKDIIAHHLKLFSDFPELRFSIENGITLCRGCHKKVHDDIGKKTRFIKKYK